MRNLTAARLVVLLILVSIVGLLSVNIVSAANCWEYDGTSQTECEAVGTGDECQWDDWGDWCMEKGCWDFWTQEACVAEENTSGCFWQTESNMGWDMGWCQEKGACWNYYTEGNSTTANTCLNVSGCLWKGSGSCQGPPGCEGVTNDTTCYDSALGCWWDHGDYCYKPGCWDYRTEVSCTGDCEWRTNAYCTEAGGSCWSHNNQTPCLAAGCNWDSYGDDETDGWCFKPSCWDYQNNASCIADTSGKCAWRTDGNYCYEKGCYNYWNQGNCTANPDSVTDGCEWVVSGYCSSPSCTAIEDETTCNASLGCTWDNTSTYNDPCTWKGCWNYDNENACNETTSCYWKPQSCMGSTGCEDLSTQAACDASTLSCWWDNGDYCMERNCWDSEFDVNQTACEDDSDQYNLDCIWDTYNSYCYEKWCGDYTTENTCNNSIRGDCYWDGEWCKEEGCWGFNDNASCSNAGCTWDADYGWCQQASATNCYNLNSTECVNATFTDKCKLETGGGGETWCTERGCWDFKSNASCSNANLDVTCEWTSDSGGGWCEDTGTNCWDYYTQTNCEDNNCTWDSTYNSCYEKGCWDYWTNTTCTANSACEWTTSASSGINWGWCEKRACWNFDNTNEASCVNNTYNLTCSWDDTNNGWCMGPWQNNCWEQDAWKGGDAASCNAVNTSGENCTWQSMNGWCYEAAKDFDDFTTEAECLSNGWGKWNGTACEISTDVTLENPGCWIFDGQPEECNAVQGCNYTAGASGTCDGAENIYCENITSLIVNNQTNQTLCEAIPMLSTCCKYQGGTCNVTYATTCWDQMADPPTGGAHCMDYNAIDSPTICEQIAGDPWYMPCKWDNTTGQCGFKEDLSTDVDDIKTKKNCEFLGYTWRTESVCGTSNCSETRSWCEIETGASTYGCDSSCWACNSSTTCKASKKGYCVWNIDTSLDQGGYCDIPNSIELNGDCGSFCGSCEYYSGGDYTPEEACGASEKGCKWDNATENCIDDNTKGCVDDCFYCFDIVDCNNNGGGASGNCKWDDYDGMCKPSNFDGEICFDGSDNDGDNEVDCSDTDCMFDPFCGGGSMGDCWSYYDNDTCINSGTCSWFYDPWSQQNRCGMKGENCWVYETNSSGCNDDADCVWYYQNHCEINRTKSEDCFTKTTQTGCEAVNGSYCIWTVDQYSPQGGWCDFAPFQCGWNSTLQRSQADCEGNNFCSWVTDPWGGSSWCEPKCFARDANGDDVYTTQAGCEGAISGGLCEWGAGWCEPNTTSVGAISEGDCATYDDNSTACEEQQGCMWFDQMMTGFSDGPGDGGFFMMPCDARHEVDCYDFTNASYCNSSYQNGTHIAGYDGTGNACRWVTEGSWSWCEPVGMHCGPMHAPFNQTTYRPQVDEAACAADSYCMIMNDTYAGGENICVGMCHNSSLTNQTACEAVLGGDVCVWKGEGAGETGGSGGGGSGPAMGGWCGPIGAAHFEQMEGGRPHELAMDTCGETGINDWNDACFLGIKEMTDDYGLGIGLETMTYAAACNGETLWDGSTGSGRKTTKGFWYLDTDGSETGNCNSDDGNSTGYEFKLIGEWSWSDNGLVESLAAKRCLNNSWTSATIGLSSYSKKMCSEMQGMFVTVRVEDLARFPTLFKPQNPMRIYATTGGENNTASSPVDSIGPGYYKPGAVDFKVEDCGAIGNVDLDNDGFYAFEDPNCKHIYLDEDKGFKLVEDCSTPQDDDMNGLTNCDDDACKDEKICDGTLAPDATDHEAPEMKSTKEKEKKNSASVEYITDERSNGTVYFYGTDSSCSLLNATIRDKGLWDEDNTNYTKYTFKHKAPIDNFTHTDALDYGLNNATMYYYKIVVCDISGNCAKTGCLNFTTKAISERKMMKFTDPDAGESWLMDKYGNGSFEAQGGVCAANTGSNSTLGEVIDPEAVPEIDISQDQNTSGGDTISVAIGGLDTAASQALDNLDMDVGTATGGSSGGTEDYVWMNESGWSGEEGVYTRGAPSNVTIVLPGNDPDLWDCEDLISGVLSNCTNITSYAESSYDSSADQTTWVIHNPTAELFSYIVAQTPAAGGGGTTTAGGGGGGAGAAATTTNETNDTEEEEEEDFAPATGAATQTTTAADKKPLIDLSELADIDLSGSATYIIAIIAVIIVVALVYFYRGGSKGPKRYKPAKYKPIKPKTFSSHRVSGVQTLQNYGFRIKRK